MTKPHTRPRRPGCRPITRLARNRRFDVQLAYGPMDWTVLVLHGFWDSWLHERDVLLPRDTEHSTDDDATAYATAYGLFIAAAVASMFARTSVHVAEFSLKPSRPFAHHS